MRENLRDHLRVLNAGDDPHLTATTLEALEVQLEWWIRATVDFLHAKSWRFHQVLDEK